MQWRTWKSFGSLVPLPVIASIRASLFGGAAFQMLKCLTAAKICDALKVHDIPAVPVIWIQPAAPGDVTSRAVTILDPDAGLHRMSLERLDPLSLDKVPELISEIETVGRGTFDPEILAILKDAYRAGSTLSEASARLISTLMNEWGPVVVDPQAAAMEPVMKEALASLSTATTADTLQGQKLRLAEAGYSDTQAESENDSMPTLLVQGLLLPVLAVVVDSFELFSLVRALPVLDALSLPRPLAWPAASATILDARSRRTLEKYHLECEDLFSGEDEVIRKITGALPYSVLAKLDGLTQEIDRQMTELGKAGSAGEDFLKTRDDCRKKVLYQIKKLRDHFDAALRRKQETAQRQVHRACNALAPNYGSQARELAGIQFLLRYSRALLGFLYDRLDAGTVEHQLIGVD